MDLGIAGRNAVITGGSLGIGYATAQELIANGVNVVLIARNRERLEHNAETLRASTSARIVAIAADLVKADEVDRAMREAQHSLGPVDILVNNAGSTPAGGLELGDEVWQKSFDLKVMGYIRAARALLPAMMERRWGRIINVIGLGAYQANPQYLAGGAINASLLAVTRTLARTVGHAGVTVNGINPGPTATPRFNDLVRQRAAKYGKSVEEEVAASMSKVPMGRPGTPEECAALVAFLASERAGYISGALVGIDGAASVGL
jgi:3-oxoacyl-[acyl-carrier protein] reductase